MKLDPSVRTKLEELAARHDAVTEQMNDPATAVDSTRIVKLAKELSALGRLVDPYRRYQTIEKQIAEAEGIMKDPATDAEFRELAEAELPELQAQADGIMDGLIDSLIIGDDANVDSIILEIRAGTGGEEAALFVRDLYEMYKRAAEMHRFKVEVMDTSPTDMGGFREVIMTVKGPSVYTYFGYEGGGHRVQRVPETEAQGRIHTSAATVAVLPEVEETDVDIDWAKDVLEFVSCAGGPGGQNVNKVASAIRLEHVPTGITVSMRDERSQHKNRAKGRRILASRVKSHYLEKEQAERSATRKSMIGSGDRNERIRTYNFPQNRCTDHRVDENYSLEKIVAGNLDEMIADLRKHDRQQRLKNM